VLLNKKLIIIVILNFFTNIIRINLYIYKERKQTYRKEVENRDNYMHICQLLFCRKFRNIKAS